MPARKHAPGYVQNDAYSQADWDEVSDNPDLTDDQLAQLRPAQDVLPPGIYAALTRRAGRPKAESPKVSVTIRLDPDVVETYKATGPGWQTRMNLTLARGAARMKRSPGSRRNPS